MIIYLVAAAGDVTGRAGYAKAFLDAAHPTILTSFADSAYRRQIDMYPPEDHEVWGMSYDPEAKIARKATATDEAMQRDAEARSRASILVPARPRRRLEED